MTAIFRLLPGALILVSITVNADSSITKCIDENGKVTFTTMGCKSSEVDTKAVEEAKARAEAEAKAKAQAQADEEARKRAVEKVGVSKTSAASDTEKDSTDTSGASDAAPESTTQNNTAPEKTESGGKSGMRGSINSDLTTGYQ